MVASGKAPKNTPVKDYLYKRSIGDKGNTQQLRYVLVVIIYQLSHFVLLIKYLLIIKSKAVFVLLIKYLLIIKSNSCFHFIN